MPQNTFCLFLFQWDNRTPPPPQVRLILNKPCNHDQNLHLNKTGLPSFLFPFIFSETLLFYLSPTPYIFQPPKSMQTNTPGFRSTYKSAYWTRWLNTPSSIVPNRPHQPGVLCFVLQDISVTDLIYHDDFSHIVIVYHCCEMILPHEVLNWVHPTSAICWSRRYRKRQRLVI